MTSTMHNVFGIDTAGRMGSIALAVDGAASGWETLAPGEHSSGITRAAERLLAERSLDWRDLDGVAVSGGPGSFTGLRIGLAWAKGVCFGLGAKLTLVSAHEANAYRHRGAARLIAPVLQGERGEVQASLWSGGAGVASLWGPERVAEGDLAVALLVAARGAGAAAPGKIAIAGPDLAPDLCRALEGAGFVLPPHEATHGSAGKNGGSGEGLPPTAVAVAELGYRALLAGGATDLALAAPSYGRAPNARKPVR
jgi:tRNA threonylcarbamoyl adenosine modification protein YeaZ